MTGQLTEEALAAQSKQASLARPRGTTSTNCPSGPERLAVAGGEETSGVEVGVHLVETPEDTPRVSYVAANSVTCRSRV